MIPWTVLATVCGASSTPELSSLAPYTAGRHVLLWGDHDEIGRKHMVRIHDLLMLNSAALAVKGVDPMQLGATEKGWDAADWNPPAEPTEALLAARCPVIQASAQTEDDAMLEPGALGAAHGIEAASVVTGRFVPFSEIQPRDVDWLWKQRIAAGEITLAHGSPGDGKSLLGVLLAASITRGLPLPGDEAVRAPGDVALIAHCGEDDPATITRPRLEAAGADLRRVHGWSADGETTLLDAAVAASLMKPVLVVVDSWAAWGDGTSENDSSAVRARFAALQPLRDAGCAVLLISHDRKADAENPQDRAAGSKQVMATPRLALHLDGSSIEQTKGNIGGKAGRLAYSIQAVPVPGVRDPQPVMTFGAETVFDDPFGPGRGDGSTDREVLEYVMSTTEAVTVNQINSALGARSQSRKRVVKAAVERCYRAGQLTRVEVERAGRKRDGFVVPEEHGSARFDHGSHHATYAPEHRSNSAPPSVGGALPNDAPVGPSPTTSSGAPSEPCSEPCSESILISGNTPPVNPPEAPIREDAQMPIVTPPPVPDAAPDKMTVEQIGDLWPDPHQHPD